MTDTPTPPKQPPASDTKDEGGIAKTLWLSVQLVWDMGWIIAIPAVVLGFIGAYLDRFFQTSPLFILLGFVLAFLFSAIGIFRKLREIMKKRF